jgi:hypothetical protein
VNRDSMSFASWRPIPNPYAPMGIASISDSQIL